MKTKKGTTRSFRINSVSARKRCNRPMMSKDVCAVNVDLISFQLCPLHVCVTDGPVKEFSSAILMESMCVLVCVQAGQGAYVHRGGGVSPAPTGRSAG